MFGTLQYSFILLIFVLAVGLVYVATMLLLALVHPPYMYQGARCSLSTAFSTPSCHQTVWTVVTGACVLAGAAGLSGVIFAMAVDESSLSPFPTRSIFGLFNVPTRVYPWVLMLLIQLLMPGVSFVGHLAGILVGTVHSLGGFNWIIPSFTTLRKVRTGVTPPHSPLSPYFILCM
jgi:hypothetical protein